MDNSSIYSRYQLPVAAASTGFAFAVSSFVNLLLALTELPFATVLVSVVDEALSSTLVIVSLVLLVTASLTGAVAAGSIASIGSNSSVGNVGNLRNGVLDGSS
jgi:hypothetical protein